MKKKEILFLFILLLIFFSLYWKTTGYDLIYDSKNLFANSPVYTGNYPLTAAFKFGFLEKMGLSLDKGTYYRPLTTLSFLIEKKIWGLNPRNLRLVNLSIFALILIGLFFFFKIQSFGFPFPHMATALFALHPLQVDNIVWIVGRSDLLMFFWGILALIFLELFCQTQRRLFVILTLLCFGLGIFSKESMLFLLPILFIYEKIKRKRITPLFHLAVFIVSISFLMVKFLLVGIFSLPAFFAQGFFHNSILILATLGYYLKSIILPYNCPSFLPPGSAITTEHIFLGCVFIFLFILLVFVSKKKINLLIPLTIMVGFLLGHLALIFTSLYPFRASSRYLIFPLLGAVWVGGYFINRLSALWKYVVALVLIISFIPFIFVNQSRYAHEISFWQKLHYEYPEQGYFTVKTAECLTNQKKYLEAETMLIKVLENRMDLPTAIDTSLLWARIEFVKARYQISQDWLHKLNKFPLYPEAVLRKGIRKAKILVSIGETVSAEKLLKTLIDKYKARELMVILYEMYLGGEKWVKAAELEDKIQKNFPGVLKRSTAESKYQFEVFSPVEKFRFFIACKNYPQAINILYSFPKDVKRELLLAKIVYWHGQEDKAKNIISSILKDYNREYPILNLVGNFYLQEMNRVKEALFYLNESLKIKRYQPEIIRLIGFLKTRYKALL